MAFSYSLPGAARSSPRVALWRRLGRLGAVSPTSGVYVLPAREECVEGFQWLAQEIRRSKGEALLLRVDQFEGLTDPQLIALFNQTRQADYKAIDDEAAELEKSLSARKKRADPPRARDTVSRLRRRYVEVSRVDYFDCAEGARLNARLERIETALIPPRPAAANVALTPIAEYRQRCWVTRPRPHVDRLACIWLIRRFVNPQARVRYALRPEPDEIAFDFSEGQFGHQLGLCTFEAMLAAFGLSEPALQAMAEIVHEIDLRDGRAARAETAGVDAVLHGWRRANLSDAELEAHGVALFEGLYAALAHGMTV
ncbi:MAG: chromate resistance protein [Chloroflexi bacterium]|nr:chromate resistance protein [Chloroflexota bacterium]